MIFHVGDRLAAGIEDCGQIYVEGSDPVFVGCLKDVSAGDDPGIVHQDIEPAGRGDRVVDQFLAIRLRPEIAGLYPDVLSAVDEPTGQVPEAARICIGGNHPIATLDEPPCDRPADSSGGTCDHRRFLITRHRCAPLLRIQRSWHLTIFLWRGDYCQRPERQKFHLGVEATQTTTAVRSGTAPAFEKYAGELISRWSEYEQPIYHGGADSSFEMELRCNWKLAVNNHARRA
jgi:hypothetical protein